MVVLTIHTTIECGVHKEVGEGVRFNKDPVTKLPVESPGIDALGNLLVARGVSVVFIEVLVIVTLGNISHFVDLVIRTLKRVLG